MRLQLALNVEDLDAAVDFYSKMFDHEPEKVRPGYANFAIDEPPLKLVLFEGAGQSGSINHLGVEVEAASQVETAASRLTSAGLETTDVSDTECCYAEKTETWIAGPDGTRWEWYVKNADSEAEAARVQLADSAGNEWSCCGAARQAAADTQGTGCC